MQLSFFYLSMINNIQSLVVHLGWIHFLIKNNLWVFLRNIEKHVEFFFFLEYYKITF